VWASFFAGRNVVRQFELTGWTKYAVKALKFLRQRVNMGFGLGRHLVKRADVRFQELGDRSFVDLIDSIKLVNAPFYNEDGRCLAIVHQFHYSHTSVEDTRTKLQALFLDQMARIKAEATGVDADLTFAFMHFPDTLQHLTTYQTMGSLLRTYAMLDDFVKTLKAVMQFDVFIILSDHGFDLEQGHSQYGFYSCNVKLSNFPKSICDFYEFLPALVTENVQKRKPNSP
jgi:hypothetical protein